MTSVSSALLLRNLYFCFLRCKESKNEQGVTILYHRQNDKLHVLESLKMFKNANPWPTRMRG